jgi:hypothetical protein
VPRHLGRSTSRLAAAAGYSIAVVCLVAGCQGWPTEAAGVPHGSVASSPTIEDLADTACPLGTNGPTVGTAGDAFTCGPTSGQIFATKSAKTTWDHQHRLCLANQIVVEGDTWAVTGHADPVLAALLADFGGREIC